MAATKSRLIQTSRSMIILDSNGMPVNLQNSLTEDAPESGFPIIAYNGKNVMPTALGYKSFFGENSQIDLNNIGSADDVHVQHVLAYQSPTLYTIEVALCEEGLYVGIATEVGGDWIKVADLPSTPEIRRLWTYCVIANKLYMYQQGGDYVYALMDVAAWNNTTIPSGIKAPAELFKLWDGTAYGCGIQRITVNFLNMEGQMGIFKGGNRLGFWDSDNAVAWSSATQVYDFVPSVTTFAGITTFADVVGSIVMIKQHGVGFIIYASKSITLVSPLSGSPEKWAGRAIFSDVGVVFDCQVVVGQPDTIHYAITSGGLAKIESGSPSFVETEVMDYIKNNNVIYGLSFLEGRYLFIHAQDVLDNPLPPANVEIGDSAGNMYTFPKPQAPSNNFTEYLSQYFNSELFGVQQDFTNAQEPIADVPPPEKLDALLPCYSGQKFKTNFVDVPDLEVGDLEDAEVTANMFPHDFTIVATGFVPGESTDFYYYEVDENFYDQGPEDMVILLGAQLGAISTVWARASELVQTLGDVSELTQPEPWEGPMPNVGIGGQAYNSELVEGPEVEFKHALYDYYLKLTNCGMQILGKQATITGKVYITAHNEEVTYPQNSQVWNTVGVLSAYRRNDSGPEITYDKSAFGYYVEGTDGLDTVMMPLNATAATMLSAYFGESLSVNVVYTVPNTHAGYSTTVQIFNQNTLAWEGYDAAGLHALDPFVPVANYANQIGYILMASSMGLDTQMRDWTTDVVNPDGQPSSPGCSDAMETITTPFYNGIGATPVLAYGTLTTGGSIITALEGSKVDTLRTYTDEFTGTCQQRPSSVTNWLTRHTDWREFGGVALLFENASNSSKVYGNLADNYALMNSALSMVTPDAVYTSAELEGAKNEGAYYLSQLPKRLIYTVAATTTVRTPEVAEDEDTLFEAEVSGFGYYSAGGGFTRTHSRSPFKPCGYADYAREWNQPDSSAVHFPIKKKLTDPPRGASKPNTPVEWDYPDPIPLPTTKYLYFRGTVAPYYPVWNEAVMLDLQLNKWGRYNNQHRGLHSLYPINRTDQTVIFNNPIRAGAITPFNDLSIFTIENPASEITYGKLGIFRQGYTRVTKATAQFSENPNAYIIVETSIDGVDIDQSLTLATHADIAYTELPFTFQGKWSTLKLQGVFNLVNLTVELGKGGRR